MRIERKRRPSAFWVEFAPRATENVRALARNVLAAAARPAGTAALRGVRRAARARGSPLCELPGSARTSRSPADPQQYKVTYADADEAPQSASAGRDGVQFLFKTGRSHPPHRSARSRKAMRHDGKHRVHVHRVLDKFGDPCTRFLDTPSVCNLSQPRRMGAPDVTGAREPPRSSSTTCAARGRRWPRCDALTGATWRRAMENFTESSGPVRRTDGRPARQAEARGTTLFIRGTCKWARRQGGLDDVCRSRVAVYRLSTRRSPRITSGNTNAPAYMTAEKAARDPRGSR